MRRARSFPFSRHLFVPSACSSRPCRSSPPHISFISTSPLDNYDIFCLIDVWNRRARASWITRPSSPTKRVSFTSIAPTTSPLRAYVSAVLFICPGPWQLALMSTCSLAYLPPTRTISVPHSSSSSPGRSCSRYVGTTRTRSLCRHSAPPCALSGARSLALSRESGLFHRRAALFLP